MHSTGSMIYTILERLRAMLDDPDLDAKYNDDWLLRHTIIPAYVDVLARLSMAADNMVTLRYSVAPLQNTQFYTLPPCIGYIHRVVNVDTTSGVIKYDWRNDGTFHPFGPGWAIQGNLLELRPFPTRDALTDESLEIWYTSNGDVAPHYATGGSITGSVLTLDTTPTIGYLDKRTNAYAGQMLRILGSSTSVWQEKMIESSDPAAGTVTIRKAFAGTSTEPQPSGSGITYEIVPCGMSQSLWDAVAAAGAMRLGTIKKVSQPHMMMIQQNYKMAIKTALDNLAYMQQRTGKRFDRNTTDNPERGWDWWGVASFPG